MFARLITLVVGLLAGAGVGQGPEIVTQYEQRLGGALDELRHVIDRFDEDAARNNLTREEALAIYARAEETFLRDRGRSMQIVLTRFDNLTKQVSDFGAANDLYKPVYLLTRADGQLLEGVMEDYSLGIPATTGGFVYSGLGLLLGCLLGGLIGRLFRRPRRAAA